MPRNTKSQIAARPIEKRKKTSKGNKSGSRQHIETKKVKPAATQVKKDKRLGSKKPVPLIGKVEKVRYVSPQEELDALENNQKLNDLLDKIDNDEELTQREQFWVEEKMARHKILCEMLGIVEDFGDDEDTQS